MATDPGPVDVAAIVANVMAAQAAPGGSSNQTFVPLWKVRPKATKENLGEYGDRLVNSAGGRPTAGKISYGGPSDGDYGTTSNQAASAFMDMNAKDRADFEKKALEAGLLKPGPDGISQAALFEAWQRATSYAATYNGDRDKSQWISPWEATARLGVSGVAGAGGAYDPFKPHTQTQTTRRDFTSGSDAAAVTGSLETIFQQEMGRAPTKKERSVYQQIVQKAYDAHPETQTSTSQTDVNGNTTGSTTVDGGIDMNATLLDQIRDTPEADSYQAGATFFDAAMQHLGAIA
jgi:hypothetical protein